MSPTSTSDDAADTARHRLARRWRASVFKRAFGDVLFYFAATLALTLAFAAPLVVQYQRDQQYGPQRVQLVFQPCEAERWNEAAVKEVFARQGELRPARAPDGSPIQKFMNVLMLPHEAEGAHEPAVLGYFELHPHTGHRPHIDGPALVQAAGCPITEIRVSPLASLVDAMQSLPQRLAKPQLMNMVIGGKTPIFNADQLGELGFGIVLYANAALQGAVMGMQKTLIGVWKTKYQIRPCPCPH